MKKLLIAALLLTNLALPSLFSEAAPENPVLPKVLIIGDSISIGYTPHVKMVLKGKAVVKHHKGNAGPTIRGVANIENWLGNTKWDVIHFNWGLWDMYGWEYWEEDRSPAMYEKRLEELVVRLKKTGATLIWGTTTPVCSMPEKSMVNRFKEGRAVISAETEKEYLEAAKVVMEKHEIMINDLHGLIAPELKKYSLAANNVHYTNDGYKKLGKQVAESIEKELKGK